MRRGIVNENDLREAMRASMTIIPPPPMESAAALTAGRRAVRRRATLAGGGVAAVMIAVTALALNSGLHASAGGGAPWAGQPSAAPAPPSTGADGKPAWPLDGDGQPQDDATARSGKHYDQGKEVLEQVLAAVPDGWTAPTGTVDGGAPLRDHQAAAEGDGSGSTWSYSAHAAVAKDGRTGRLLADVRTKGNGLPTEPCALARKFWVTGGDCTVVTVGKAKVGVVTLPAGRDRVDQWAAHRYADGVVVFVAQSRNAANVKGSLRPLKNLPLSKQQLAALAVDDRFDLD
jgi:hypothetical protein